MQDPYTKYCFDKLKKEFPEYLEKIGFSKEKDFDFDQIVVAESKGISCRYCKSTNTIQRSQQMRSADEGETLVTHCRSCTKTF